MATLKAIRRELVRVIEAAIPEMKGYPTLPDSINSLPAVVVVPYTTSFSESMGRGTDRYELDMLVLVSTNDMGLRQEDLDEYVSGAGPKSIRRAIWQAVDGPGGAFGTLPDTDAHVDQMLDYGARFAFGDVEHIGARLRVIILTKGMS